MVQKWWKKKMKLLNKAGDTEIELFDCGAVPVYLLADSKLI